MGSSAAAALRPSIALAYSPWLDWHSALPSASATLSAGVEPARLLLRLGLDRRQGFLGLGVAAVLQQPPRVLQLRGRGRGRLSALTSAFSAGFAAWATIAVITITIPFTMPEPSLGLIDLGYHKGRRNSTSHSAWDVDKAKSRRSNEKIRREDHNVWRDPKDANRVPCQPRIDKFLGLLSNAGSFCQTHWRESDHEQKIRRAIVG